MSVPATIGAPPSGESFADLLAREGQSPDQTDLKTDQQPVPPPRKNFADKCARSRHTWNQSSITLFTKTTYEPRYRRNPRRISR